MDMASEQAFLGSSWHRPEHFPSSMHAPPVGADVSPPGAAADAFYRHHAGMDAATAGGHAAGYFNSRAAAMHGFRSTAGQLHFRFILIKRQILLSVERRVLCEHVP